MATFALLGLDSSLVNDLPIIGCTSSTVVQLVETRALYSCRGDWPPDSGIDHPGLIAATVTVLASRSMKSSSAGEMVLPGHTATRRSGCPNGSGRRRTPLTMLKIAVLAPMPIAK